MLFYRVLCGLLLAGAVKWVLTRSQATGLLQEVPEMDALGPIAGALVGFFSLSARQGWGFVVAVANGLWAGLLAISLAGTLYVAMELTQAVRGGRITSLDRFVTVFGESLEPLIYSLTDLPLLIVSLGAAAIVGVITELLHWLLVRFRRRRQRSGRIWRA